MQLVNVKAIRIGDPLPKGVADEGAAALIQAFTKIKQPTSEGISTNFSIPTANRFYRAGEKNPYAVIRDPSSGSQELTWNVPDFDAETKKLYLGDQEFAAGDIYEGEKAFAFDTETGATIVFSRLKYTATLSGGLSVSAPMTLAVSAEVMAPEEGGAAWDVIATPSYTEDAMA